MFSRTQLNMNIINVWLLFGTMHLVSRALTVQQSGDDFFDINCAQQILFLLLGMTTYFIVVKQFLPITSQNKVVQSVINDILMFGTAFVVVRVLSNESLTDSEWLKACATMLGGLVTYDLVVHRFIPDTRYSSTMHTLAKYGSMFVVSQALLASISDSNWQLCTLYSLTGFATYELLVRPLAKQLFGITGTTNELEQNDNTMYNVLINDMPKLEHEPVLVHDQVLEQELIKELEQDQQQPTELTSGTNDEKCTLDQQFDIMSK